MVAHNPLFHGRWTLERFNSTVINDIWPEVLLFTLVATMVSCVSELTPHQLVISNQLLTVLGTVLGLVISFRTSSAYERYQDGRKMWTNIVVASRNLALMLWIHVRSTREGEEAETLKGIIEKKSMINLIQAFSVSVKHFLRGEPGVYYKDLYPLVCFLPQHANPQGDHSDSDLLPLWRASDDLPVDDPPVDELHHGLHGDNVRTAADIGHHPQRTSSLPTHSRNDTMINDNKSETSWFRSLTKSNSARPSRRNTFDHAKVLPEVHSTRPLKEACNPPEASVYDYFPFLRFFRWCVRKVLGAKAPGEDAVRRKKKSFDTVESNVPLEICLVLSNYTAFLTREKRLDASMVSGVTNNLTMLQDTMSNLERIRNTPLPFAYQAHLRMSLWLYLLFLPFQIFAAFGWYTIPGTAFASFLLLGFLEIGQEIENPFNYDLNDLDLDHFCLSIQRELHEITAYTSPEPTSYLFDIWNKPFAPSDPRSVPDILREGGVEYRSPDHHNGPEPGIASIRRTLINNWREVDKAIRKN